MPERISENLGEAYEIARTIAPNELRGQQDLTAELDPDLLRSERIWGVILSAGSQDMVSVALLLRLKMDGVRVLTEARFWEEEASHIDPDSPDTSWLFSGRGFRYGPLANFGRALFDIVSAMALLIMALPLMLVVALLIKLDSAGPVFYRQERVGLHGKAFTLLKFRSMRKDAEAPGRPVWAEIADPRITRMGQFIRYTRIDELPQLLNVLRGEMSLIGPRPERPYFVEKLASAIPLYSVRHYVKPGITGWAQVNASYGASIEDALEKLRYDLYYIKNRSFILDLLILWRTLRVVVFRQGAR